MHSHSLLVLLWKWMVMGLSSIGGCQVFFEKWLFLASCVVLLCLSVVCCLAFLSISWSDFSHTISSLSSPVYQVEMLYWFVYRIQPRQLRCLCSLVDKSITWKVDGHGFKAYPKQPIKMTVRASCVVLLCLSVVLLPCLSQYLLKWLFTYFWASRIVWAAKVPRYLASWDIQQIKYTCIYVAVPRQDSISPARMNAVFYGVLLSLANDMYEPSKLCQGLVTCISPLRVLSPDLQTWLMRVLCAGVGVSVNGYCMIRVVITDL